MDTGIVAISQEELDNLKEDSLFLKALHNAGVDNWEGYPFAQDLYGEEKKYRQKEGIS